LREIREIGEKERQLHDIVERCAGRRRNGAQILERLLDLPIDRLAQIAARRVESELSGQVQRTSGADALRIGAQCRGGGSRIDHVLRHASLSGRVESGWYTMDCVIIMG